MADAPAEQTDPEGDGKPPVTDPKPPAGDPAKPETPAELGDAGKRALDAERKRASDAEKALKAMQAELDALKAAGMTEQEKAIADAKKAGAAEATGAVQLRLFGAEVRAAAAGKVTDPDLLSDPDVAMRLLGMKELPVDATGDIDGDAIAKAIDALLEKKPYLKASATRATGSGDGGPRGTAKPGQLSREDLKTMSPEAIVKAKADGRLNDLLGISA